MNFKVLKQFRLLTYDMNKNSKKGWQIKKLSYITKSKIIEEIDWMDGARKKMYAFSLSFL